MRWPGYLWAFPVTVVGLLLALSAAISGGAAMTLGHVILARDEACLDRSRPHELGHVRQFERWGPLLLPTYWAIAAWLKWRGRHPYLDHPFEV